MKFFEKFGSYAMLFVAMVVLGWFALFFLTPLASSAEITTNWDWWLHGVARNWKLVLIGCVALAAIASVADIADERVSEKNNERH